MMSLNSRTAIAAGVISSAVLLGACGSNEPTSITDTGGSGSIEQPLLVVGSPPAVSPPASVAGTDRAGIEHRFFEYVDPIDQVHVTYLPMDLEDFAANAQVLFIGSIADVVPRVGTRDVGTEQFPRDYVYDGLVFDVEKVLSGDLPKGSQDRATFAVEVLIDWGDPGRADTPIRLDSMERLSQGLDAAKDGEEPVRYLIFATTTKLGDQIYLRFMGPGSSGLVDGAVVVEGGGFVIDRPYGGGKMTVDAVLDWMTNGPPQWEPPLSERPSKDAPPGSIATDLGDPAEDR